MFYRKNFAFITSILFVGLIATPAVVYATPAYNGIIGLSPAQITVAPGQVFTISIDVYDDGVTYNSASVSIDLGDGISFVGADYAGSAFNTAGTQETDQGKYNSCAVIGRSSTTLLTGTSHLVNAEFEVSSNPDYDTSHNGTSIEQDWTGCGPSSDVYLNGNQANQGAEEGGEVFVNLTTETPPAIPTSTLTPKPPTVVPLLHAPSGQSSTATTPEPSARPEASQVKAVSTDTAASVQSVPSKSLIKPVISSKVTAKLVSDSKPATTSTAVRILVIILLIAAVFTYFRLKWTRNKKIAPKLD
jgi:hypothetical protein